MTAPPVAPQVIAGEEPLLLWVVATRALPGEGASGDGFCVASFEEGVLVAVIDGLGHGSEAATATAAAVEVLRQQASAPLLDLMRDCHEALRRTRGAVITLASIDRRTETLSWLGVGNVEAVRFCADGAAAREALMLRSGVVGYRLPLMRAASLPIADGDTLVLATDGIRHDFATVSPIRSTPRESAARILRDYARATDDALVMVAQYRRGRP